MLGAGSATGSAVADEARAADCASEAIRAAGTGGVNTVKVSAFDVPPPPPSLRVKTVTGIIDALRTSAAEIAALSPVGPANVVVRRLPFHWTTEHGTRLPPLAPLASTPSMNARDFAGILKGMSAVMTGTGNGVVDGAIVNREDKEDKDGIVELETVTFTGPGKAVSVAEIAAVSCVALTKVVWRGAPFQFTTSPLGTKFVPLTVRVMPAGAQAGVVFDDVVDAESDMMVGRAIGNETELEVFALDAGLATATFTVLTEAMSATVTAAVSCVELTNVVVSSVKLLLLSTHCTLEHGRKLLPATLRENAAVPAVAPAGEIEAITAAGSDAAEIVKEAAAELTPELDTVIDAVPAEAISEAGIVAVSCVELTNVVARGEPFQSTTEPFTKFAPFTVRVKPKGLHDGVVFDEVVEDDKEVMVGARIVNWIFPEVPPPGPIVNNLTCEVPTARKSVAGTVALSCVALTNVVVSVDVTLLAFTH